MSDRRIKQIRERLEAATPGPFGVGWNREFIANAPADIAYLLEQVEAARDAYGRGRDDEAPGSPVVEYP